jgi:hypothetical protein
MMWMCEHSNQADGPLRFGFNATHLGLPERATVLKGGPALKRYYRIPNALRTRPGSPDELEIAPE